MKVLSATLALISAVSMLNDKSKMAAFAMPLASALEEENSQGLFVLTEEEENSQNLFALTEEDDIDEGHWAEEDDDDEGHWAEEDDNDEGHWAEEDDGDEGHWAEEDDGDEGHWAEDDDNDEGYWAEEDDEDEGHWELIGDIMQGEEDVTEEEKGASGDSNQNDRKLWDNRFTIDCYHNTYDYGETNNKITAKFYRYGWPRSGSNYIGEDDTDSSRADSNCNWWDRTALFWPQGDNDHNYDAWGWVDITSSGTDAYMIDRAWTYVRDNNLTFGANNHGVWCVSNDRADRFGGSYCHRKLRFVIHDSGWWMKRGKVYGWKASG